MDDRVTFIEMISYSFKVFAQRPLHTLIFVAFYSCLTAAYYLWASSPSGLAFYAGYFQSLHDLANQKGYGSYYSYLGIMMGVGLVYGSIFYSAAYRLLVREAPLSWVPIQLGKDEVRTFFTFLTLSLLMISLMILFAVIMMIIIFALTIIMSLFSRGENDITAIQGIIASFAIFFVLPIYVAILYFMGRFLVSIPLGIKFRRFTLTGWSASKEMGWSLFWSHVVIAIIIGIMQLVLTVPLLMMSMEFAQNSTASDIDSMAKMTTLPLGNLTYPMIPVMMMIPLIFLGPTAAVASFARDPNAPDPQCTPPVSDAANPTPAE